MENITGSEIVFLGFFVVYDEGKDEDKGSAETKLPSNLELNDSLEIDSISPQQHFTKPPPRFTEAV